MPLYEYHCPKDGTFEKMQKFSDPPLTECPKCGGPVEKLLSAPAIQFKGTGWYVTDYARKSGGESSKSKETSSKDGGSKDGGTKDAGSKDSKDTTTTTKAETAKPKDNK